MFDEAKMLVIALLAGLFVGIFFTAIRLPLPAPPALTGIMGIVGIYLGHKFYVWLIDTFFKTQ
jgi:XapX domain-containing protein